MATEERFFYHCFPRGQQANADLGIKTLGLIAKIGFVLTPEVIAWDEPIATGRGPTLKKLQRRICFTQLPKGELKQHCATFGDFAIQYSYETLRRIGGIPVFYVPQNRNQEVALDSAGSMLACRLHIIRKFFQNMVELKNMLNQPTLPAIVRLESPTFQTDVSAVEAKKVTDYLDIKPFSFEEFFYTIDAVQNLLLPTENPQHNGELAYYQQREWRIIENYAMDGERLAKDLTEEQKQELLQTSTAFFDKDFTDENGLKRKRVDFCLVYPTVAKNHVLTFATNVLVPALAVDSAKAVLKSHGINVPVLDIDGYLAGKV
ncbi:MAG: abortive infection system antitoxin AbiGi family protein [Verrucomicrobiota bacterium]